ncbi:unnamed protein product [Rhizoctonia solani]|uniref:Zn(2)-C6 fungal-type domain-containing protein n=1 Tax=Rhizoctonia solani TaxID=456999 RepID=A0A8H3CEB1_9AGAM|nr:unnamed protein product [Rhizoctonia solani]
MSNIIVVPRRSTGGCLTCKRRKKKCDEQRPFCRRCIQGDFDCLGYGFPEDSYITNPSSNTEVGSLHRSPDTVVGQDAGQFSDPVSLDSLIPLPEHPNRVAAPARIHSPAQEFTLYPSMIPKSLTIDPLILEDATSLTLSQFVRLSQRLLFKPPSVPFETGLLWRIGYSDFTRWSMYLSARVLTDVSNGINGQKYMDWIFRFCQQILKPSASMESLMVMEGRLGGLHDLTYLGFIVSGIAFGYSLFQRSAQTFLRLATLDPDLWSDDSTISISQALRSRYEITRFVTHDTLIACILGIPPLLHYDTTFLWCNQSSNRVIELIYGITPEILYFLAKINACRASQLMDEEAQNQSDWREIERLLKGGSSTIEHTDEPVKDIARFAVQETWRQATLIYFYMGTRDVNSADPRVEAAVRQVVQLGNTIGHGSTLELHTLIPCVIAGAAARQERHRASLRNKIVSRSLYREVTLLLRTSEFAAVLDHLWHGAGAEGKPTTWQDYRGCGYTRWSMYLSARVLKDISDGMNGRKYTNWIFQLHQQILESLTPTEAAIAMEGQLARLHDLAYLGFIASGATLGYSLFRRCIPIFLRLAVLDSNLWSDSATISISQAIQCTYEISKVFVHDTLIAFILGIPPLPHYDITFPRGSAKPNNELELVYGIPSEVLYFLAKINACRASRLVGGMAQTLSDWHSVERVLKTGSSTIEHTSEPAKDIERFAVQENWRQATLIYFYMGVGDVNSADARVEAAVQQVVQLGSTIESGSTLELHTLIPCVIAGAAARKEKHRARLRSKIVSRSFPYEIAMVIRTSEFAAVLDHLWHGAGAEGKPTTWEDYVQSCRAILRVV